MPPLPPRLTTLTHLPLKRQYSDDSSGSSTYAIIVVVVIFILLMLAIFFACREAAQKRKDRERLKQIAIATQQTAQIATATANLQAPVVNVSEFERKEAVAARAEKGETERVELEVTKVIEGELEGRPRDGSMNLRPTYELPGGK